MLPRRAARIARLGSEPKVARAIAKPLSPTRGPRLAFPATSAPGRCSGGRSPPRRLTPAAPTASGDARMTTSTRIFLALIAFSAPARAQTVADDLARAQARVEAARSEAGAWGRWCCQDELRDLDRNLADL